MLFVAIIVILAEGSTLFWIFSRLRMHSRVQAYLGYAALFSVFAAVTLVLLDSIGRGGIPTDPYKRSLWFMPLFINSMKLSVPVAFLSGLLLWNSKETPTGGGV